MLRLPLLALALAVLAAAGAQVVRADDAAPVAAATVTIAPSDGGPPRTLDLAALTDRFDVHGVTYTLREADGTTTTQVVAEGISLTALLAAAGLDADAFTYMEVPRADGSSAIVLLDDVGGTGEGPPVVWADEQGVHLLRPSSGERDANADDLVTLPGGALSIALRTGEPLVPRIQVVPLRARPRQRVDFSASLAIGRLGPGMDYQWYFDGTGRATGANVSHRFPRSGVFHVLLNVVRGDGTSIGLPDTVDVHVVRPHERRSDDAHRSDEAQEGDDSGSGGSGAGSGGSGGSGSGPGTGSTSAAPLTFGPPPAAPPVASPPPTPAPAPSQASPPPRQPRGDVVSGTLIASAAAAATPAGGTQAAHAVARNATADGPLHVPIGIWVGAGLVLLLALGWVLESRHTLPFWQP